MKLVNRKDLVLEEKEYTFENGVKYTVRRGINDPHHVYALKHDGSSKTLKRVPIDCFQGELREFILNDLEYYEGSSPEALNQGLVEGFPPGKYRYLSQQTVNILFQKSLFVHSEGWYSESELNKVRLKKNKRRKYW